MPTSKRSTSPLGRHLPAPPQTREKKRNEVRLPLTNAAIEKGDIRCHDRKWRANSGTQRSVIATGLYQRPKIPAFSVDFPAGIRQVHSDTCRNPQELLPGAVLVVGSAQSGAQIAEELYESGRKVYLAVGRAGRTPRRYRGKDANWWLEKLGHYNKTVAELPSPKAKFAGKPHISGARGGHTLNLHQFARDGVTLLGHLCSVQDGKIQLASDLYENLAAADRSEAEFVKEVDAYIARTGLEAPQETLPTLRDGFAQPVLTELDLRAANITNVIWATSYEFDFSLVKLPMSTRMDTPSRNVA